MPITELLLPTYRQMLTALAAWLRKAGEQADEADKLMAGSPVYRPMKASID